MNSPEVGAAGRTAAAPGTGAAPRLPSLARLTELDADTLRALLGCVLPDESAQRVRVASFNSSI